MSKTVNLYDPITGQGSVWNEADVEARLAEGMITQDAWQEICDQEAAKKYTVWLTSSDTLQERFYLLRSLRDAKIAKTDYLLSADYPISQEKLEAVKLYRQALRDLPSQEGAPWDGGGDMTPWPIEP